MNELDKKSMTLLDLCKMATGELPETFTKNNENLWKAFEIGRKYETALQDEIKNGRKEKT